jgi:hypothetical protein
MRCSIASDRRHDTIRQLAVGVSRHELENIFSGGRNNIRVGSAGPCAANLYGLDIDDRGLVSAEVGELGRHHRRKRPRSFRV